MDNFKRYVNRRCIGYNYRGGVTESAYECEVETADGVVVRKYLIVKTATTTNAFGFSHNIHEEVLQDERPFLQIALAAE